MIQVRFLFCLCFVAFESEGKEMLVSCTVRNLPHGVFRNLLLGKSVEWEPRVGLREGLNVPVDGNNQ